MEELEKKLKVLKEFLEKGMQNAGIGGTGSVKAGAALPTISKLSKPGHTSIAGKVKIPSTTPVSKKNPVKSAEQTQNKDIKDMKMKEAQAHLKISPMAKQEQISFEKNGQWTLEDLDKSEDEPIKESKPAFEGSYHGQDHERITERGHKLVHFPIKNPDGSPGLAQRKIPNKVKVVHTWDHNKKEWKHKETVNTVNVKHMAGEGNTKNAKSPMEIAQEKANAPKATSTESKTKTIRRKLEEVKKTIEEMDKSGYKGYTPEDNARRKAGNIGETTGIHSMDSIKQYGGSGPSAAANEAKKMKQKSKKNPVKVYTSEEIKALNEKQG